MADIGTWGPNKGVHDWKIKIRSSVHGPLKNGTTVKSMCHFTIVASGHEVSPSLSDNQVVSANPSTWAKWEWQPDDETDFPTGPDSFTGTQKVTHTPVGTAALSHQGNGYDGFYNVKITSVVWSCQGIDLSNNPVSGAGSVSSGALLAADDDLRTPLRGVRDVMPHTGKEAPSPSTFTVACIPPAAAIVSGRVDMVCSSHGSFSASTALTSPSSKVFGTAPVGGGGATYDCSASISLTR